MSKIKDFMTIIDKPKKVDPKLKVQIPSLESFEETYKTAYTHGLEVIYSLENVDLKTVRRIEEYKPHPVEVPDTSTINSSASPFQSQSQLEFDLGYDYQAYVEPYFLNESIQMLGLTSQAENCLCEHGMKTVADLLAFNFKQFVFMKGMGQGHIDEVKKKLEKYVGARSLKYAYTIDFRSMFLGLTIGVPFKKLSLFLKRFNLADEVPLTLAEKIEARTFENSKDKNVQDEVLAFLKNPDKHKEALLQLEKIAKVFLIPWARSRCGIATEDELTERLEGVTEKKHLIPLYLKLIREIFTQGNFPFAAFFSKSNPASIALIRKKGSNSKKL